MKQSLYWILTCFLSKSASGESKYGRPTFLEACLACNPDPKTAATALPDSIVRVFPHVRQPAVSSRDRTGRHGYGIALASFLQNSSRKAAQDKASATKTTLLNTNLKIDVKGVSKSSGYDQLDL